MSEGKGPAPRPGADRGEPSLGWLLAALGQRASAGFRAVLPEGVHPRQFAVLDRLRAFYPDGAGMSQRALADDLGIPPGRLVPLLDDLEDRGWAERRSVPGDRRTHRIGLTAAGARAADGMRRAAQDYERALTAGLTSDERRVLRELLARLTFPGEEATPAVW